VPQRRSPSSGRRFPTNRSQRASGWALPKRGAPAGLRDGKTLGDSTVTPHFQAQISPLSKAEVGISRSLRFSTRLQVQISDPANQKGEGDLKNVEGGAGFQKHTLSGDFSCSAVTVWTHLLFSPVKSAASIGAKNSNPVCNA